MNCPICNKRHRTPRTQHACIARAMKHWGSQATTGMYDEITSYSPPQRHGPGPAGRISAQAIIALFRDSLEDEYCEFNRKGRGSSLNHDLYGYDPAQGVAVIQARQCIGTKYGKSSRKTYFLCGHNEITHEPFRHPISSSAIRGAINAGADSMAVVHAAQRWMWQVTSLQLSKSSRQGDLLLVPEHAPKTGGVMGQIMTLAGSHEVHADEIRQNGRIYALNPRLIHTKGQHHPVKIQGWASVRVAREASAWDFAVRRGD